MEELYPNRLLGEVSKALGSAGVVSVDVGQHMIWSYQAFQNREGQKLLFSGGHGAMGYALPAAIGAYYATEKPVACICGDGAFQMNIQELQWVKRENIPVRILVLNNQALGLIRQQQKDYFDGVFAGASEEGGFTSCQFAEVAKGYGIAAAQVSYGEAAEKLPGLLEGKGPILVEILLENSTCAYPKTCLGEPIHNQRPYMDKEIYEKMLQL